jgi:hypothetical protein
MTRMVVEVALTHMEAEVKIHHHHRVIAVTIHMVTAVAVQVAVLPLVVDEEAAQEITRAVIVIYEAWLPSLLN